MILHDVISSLILSPGHITPGLSRICTSICRSNLVKHTVEAVALGFGKGLQIVCIDESIQYGLHCWSLSIGRNELSSRRADIVYFTYIFASYLCCV